MKRTRSPLATRMVVRDGELVLSILQERNGLLTKVILDSGNTLTVHNIAWGRDLGDDFDHITTNVSPRPADKHSIDFFYTSDVVAVVAMEDGKILFKLEG